MMYWKMADAHWYLGPVDTGQRVLQRSLEISCNWDQTHYTRFSSGPGKYNTLYGWKCVMYIDSWFMGWGPVRTGADEMGECYADYAHERHGKWPWTNLLWSVRKFWRSIFQQQPQWDEYDIPF